MKRLETSESELTNKILSKLYSISFNCKKQTGIYQITRSQSTRSIYVMYLDFTNNSESKLRISDHRASMVWGCDAQIQTTFTEFNNNFKNILRKLKAEAKN
jgi:hypothetical protein